MPRVKFIGGASREDNTEIIKLADADDGTPRHIYRGGEAVEVTHEELKQLASGYEVQVIEDESASSSSPLVDSDESSGPGTVPPTGASTASSAGSPATPSASAGSPASSDPISRGGQ